MALSVTPMLHGYGASVLRRSLQTGKNSLLRSVLTLLLNYAARQMVWEAAASEDEGVYRKRRATRLVSVPAEGLRLSSRQTVEVLEQPTVSGRRVLLALCVYQNELWW